MPPSQNAAAATWTTSSPTISASGRCERVWPSMANPARATAPVPRQRSTRWWADGQRPRVPVTARPTAVDSSGDADRSAQRLAQEVVVAEGVEAAADVGDAQRQTRRRSPPRRGPWPGSAPGAATARQDAAGGRSARAPAHHPPTPREGAGMHGERRERHGVFLASDPKLGLSAKRVKNSV